MTDLEFAQATRDFIDEMLPQLKHCVVDIGKLNDLAMESTRRIQAPKCYTVLLDYVNSEGNYLDSVEANSPQEALVSAIAECIYSNGWETGEEEELDCLLVIEGSHQDVGYQLGESDG